MSLLPGGGAFSYSEDGAGIFQRRAEWVWRPRGLTAIPFGTPTRSPEEEANRYVYFRRSFRLDGPVERALIHACADGRYQLFVNGMLVGRGPSRSQPECQQFDSYAIDPLLRPGPNVIAALVHSYGRPTAWYELPEWEPSRAFGCGGFFLQGDVETPAGTLRLDTGPEWRCLESKAWERDVPAGSLGFIEIYDARRAPQGWQEPDFDDRDWPQAEVLRVPGRNFVDDIIPFPGMRPRDIPAQQEGRREPVTLAAWGQVRNAPPASDIATLFQQEPLKPLTTCQVTDLEALIRGDGVATIRTTAEESVSLVLDFGRTVAGRVTLEMDGPAGAVVDFTHSERLADDGRVRIHQGIPGFDVPLAHRVTLREGPQRWEAFELAGFRYLQLTVRQADVPVQLRSVHVRTTGYPVQERRRFACSDELLNRIWQTGVETLRLCMHDAYIDCPSREQRQWMGDGYVQMLINFVAFGDTRLAARLLRQIAASQLPSGLTMMCAPGDFAVKHFINIPDFCLYWILALERYFLFSGDRALVQELYPRIVKALAWFRQFLGPNHLLTDVPHWVFIDWAELDKKGQVTALNAQYVASLNALASLAQVLGYSQDSREHQALAQRVTQAINAHLWDEDRGIYVDARRNGVQSRRISQQSNAATMAFGVAPAERWARILATVMDPERLVLTRVGEREQASRPFDPEWNVVLAQPFYSHHLHRALSQAGRWDLLLANIRQHWGGLLEAGATTWRETWQLDELTSLCHAWAGTPTFDLSTEILGVKPLTPGFERFQVAPHPVDLSWAQGIVPTPLGDVEVGWRRAEGAFRLSVTVPPKAEAQVLLPDEVSGRVTVDGTPQEPGAIHLGPGEHQVHAQS